MAITFDETDQVVSSSGVTIAGPMTISASANLVTIGVGVRDNGSNLPTNVYINSSEATIAVRNTGALAVNSDIWYLINPPTGNVTITLLLAGSDQVRWIASSYIFDSGTPAVDTTGGSALDADPVIDTVTTSNAPAVIVSMIIHEYRDAPVVTNSDNTTLFSNDEGVWGNAGSYVIKSSTGNATMSYTTGGADIYAHSIAAFYESGGAPPVVTPANAYMTTMTGMWGKI